MEHPFAAWETFYVILGSSAAALTGLQFLVVVLGSEVGALSQPALRAFGTPTIVNFCAALLLSVVLTAPWPSMTGAAICLILFALGGLGYHGRAVWHARRQTDYEVVLEDWLWFFIFPTLAYVAVLVAAFNLASHTLTALFIAGGATIVLLFAGIHNAWDSVTYIALSHRKP